MNFPGFSFLFKVLPFYLIFLHINAAEQAIKNAEANPTRDTLNQANAAYEAIPVDKRPSAHQKRIAQVNTAVETKEAQERQAQEDARKAEEERKKAEEAAHLNIWSTEGFADENGYHTAPPAQTTTPTTPASTNANGETQYVDANGNGLIKGSSSGIYHLPGSKYYDKTTRPVRMFKTISEAEQAGFRAPKR